MPELYVAGGQITLDHIACVDRLPQVDAVSLQPGFHHQLQVVYSGGCSLNIAVAAAKLGLEVHYGGLVGQDWAEYPELKKARALLADKSPWFVLPQKLCHCYQIYDAKNQKLSFMDGLLDPFDELYTQATGQQPLLCLAAPKGSRYAPCLHALLEKTLDAGQITAISLVSGDRPLATELLNSANYLFLNRYEAARMREQNPAGLFGEQTKAVFITTGEQGVELHQKEAKEIAHIPGVALPHVEDTTGAGDSFAAGAMAALCRGNNPLVAARVGSVTASYVVQKRGGQTGQPSWEQMKERYALAYGKWEGTE